MLHSLDNTLYYIHNHNKMCSTNQSLLTWSTFKIGKKYKHAPLDFAYLLEYPFLFWSYLNIPIVGDGRRIKIAMILMVKMIKEMKED